MHIKLFVDEIDTFFKNGKQVDTIPWKWEPLEKLNLQIIT